MTTEAYSTTYLTSLQPEVGVGSTTWETLIFSLNKIFRPNTVQIGEASDKDLQAFLQEARVAVSNMQDIKDFIHKHPEVFSYLRRGVQVIRGRNPEQSFEAEIVYEPESEEAREILFLYIMTKDNPAYAMRFLDTVDKILFEDEEIVSDFFAINIKFFKA